LIDPCCVGLAERERELRRGYREEKQGIGKKKKGGKKN
jgi:hypothetical protein